MLAATEASLLGLAAIITAVAGVISAIVGALKSRREGKEQADEALRAHLRECRDESERLAEELHALKMRRFDREG